VRYREQTVPVTRRVGLFVREYEPAGGAERTVVLLHGAGEHGGRHRHVALRFCRHGWRVLTPDLRGYGRSGGRSAHVVRFDTYVDDLARIYDQFALAPELTAQVGHSMGGLATVRFTQRHPSRVKAIALSSPLLGLTVRIPPALLVSGRVLSMTYPWKRFRTVLNPADVTRNAEAIVERTNDPLFRRSVTAGWFFAVQTAIRRAWRAAGAVTIPVLIAQSGDDRVVDGEAARAWLGTVGSADARFELLAGQFHELHYEDEWRATADLMQDWLAARMTVTEKTVAKAA
jgi:lysophospholipase